jgi:uncharacterized spore protein YtfJ
MSRFEMLKQIGDAMTVRQVFGEPYERDGLTLIPVARVMGGGGGGGSQDQQSGEGGGYGMIAAPAGVYVVKDGRVKWEPALDINRIVLGGQIVALAVVLALRPLIKTWIKRRSS